MTRVTKNELERVFFSFFGHTKNLALQAYFSPHYQKSPFGPKKLLGWARRKTRGVWPLKGQEVGEQNWVYYELGGGLERPFCPGCHTNSEVKTAFAHPSSSPRNANTFFFNPTSEIGTPGGFLAFPLLEQIYSLCGGGWMGVAELCIGHGAVAERTRMIWWLRPPAFTPLPKIAFWS